MHRCFIYNVLIRMNKFLAKLNKLDWKSKQKLNAQMPILRAPPKWYWGLKVWLYGRTNWRRGCVASGGQEQEACDCGSRVWQRWCRKRERKVATARAVLHGRRAATARGMPQCMVSILRPQMFIYFFFFCNLQMFVYIAWIYQIWWCTKRDRRFTSENSW